MAFRDRLWLNFYVSLSMRTHLSTIYVIACVRACVHSEMVILTDCVINSGQSDGDIDGHSNSINEVTIMTWEKYRWCTHHTRINDDHSFLWKRTKNKNQHLIGWMKRRNCVWMEWLFSWYEHRDRSSSVRTHSLNFCSLTCCKLQYVTMKMLWLLHIIFH